MLLCVIYFKGGEAKSAGRTVLVRHTHIHIHTDSRPQGTILIYIYEDENEIGKMNIFLLIENRVTEVELYFFGIERGGRGHRRTHSTKNANTTKEEK